MSYYSEQRLCNIIDIEPVLGYNAPVIGDIMSKNKFAELFIVHNGQLNAAVKGYESLINKTKSPVRIHECNYIGEVGLHAAIHNIEPQLILIDASKIDSLDRLDQNYNYVIVAGDNAAKAIKEKKLKNIQVVLAEDLGDYLTYVVNPSITKGAHIPDNSNQIDDETVIAHTMTEVGNQKLKDGQVKIKKEAKEDFFRTFKHPAIYDSDNYKSTADYANNKFRAILEESLDVNFKRVLESGRHKADAQITDSVYRLTDAQINMAGYEPSIRRVSISFRDLNKDVRFDKHTRNHMFIYYCDRNNDERKVVYECLVKAIKHYNIVELIDAYKLNSGNDIARLAQGLMNRFKTGGMGSPLSK